MPRRRRSTRRPGRSQVQRERRGGEGETKNPTRSVPVIPVPVPLPAPPTHPPKIPSNPHSLYPPPPVRSLYLAPARSLPRFVLTHPRPLLFLLLSSFPPSSPYPIPPPPSGSGASIALIMSTVDAMRRRLPPLRTSVAQQPTVEEMVAATEAATPRGSSAAGTPVAAAAAAAAAAETTIPAVAAVSKARPHTKTAGTGLVAAIRARKAGGGGEPAPSPAPGIATLSAAMLTKCAVNGQDDGAGTAQAAATPGGGGMIGASRPEDGAPRRPGQLVSYFPSSFPSLPSLPPYFLSSLDPSLLNVPMTLPLAVPWAHWHARQPATLTPLLSTRSLPALHTQSRSRRRAGDAPAAPSRLARVTAAASGPMPPAP